MKQGLYFRIGLFLLISVVLVNCKKDDDPAPFIDGYEPKLTDPKGTPYEGDYFPVEEGYTWTYTDILTVTGSFIISYSDLAESVSISTNPYYTTQELEIGSGKTINLNGSSISVLPGKNDSITSYFQKTDSSINIPAYYYSGEIYPLANPFYIKKTLKVGDKWLADPVINFDKYLETALSTDEDSKVTKFSYSASKSYIYVIGPDTISWTRTINGKDSTQKYRTIKLEHRAEVIGEADISNDTIPGKLNFTAKITENINLLDTIGKIRGDYFIEIAANGFYLVGGSERVNISMNYSISVKSILNKTGLVKNQSSSSPINNESQLKSLLHNNNAINQALRKAISKKNRTL